MEVEMINEYKLGDMTARYLQDIKTGCTGLYLLPAELDLYPMPEKNMALDPMIQLKMTGDIYEAAYGMGISMRNSETVRGFRFREQSETTKGDVHEIRTVLEDYRQHQVIHHLKWKEGTSYVRIYCTFENRGDTLCTLEMFESFSLGNLSPYLDGDGYNSMFLHRIRSVWSQEGRLECIPLEDLQLEPAWDPHAVRCEKYGQAGSMPVNRFFPFAAVEDRKNHVFWGAQIAHPASWQMEVYRKDDGLALSGGLADRDFGQWTKRIGPGESFRTPEAIVSAARTDSIDIFTGRLTQAAEESLEMVPESEKELPVIFNEYCTTWGNPSHENICSIVEKIRDKGFRYFVIDCGWYKEEGVPWDISMGDYEISRYLFPEGLEKTTEAIRNAGMIPGIWFEIETVGSAARAYHMEEHLLQKDGVPLTSYFRRFWNMQDPWVESYLTEKVIGTLKKYGFGYMKIDYNETIGTGCDGKEAPGEELRKNMEASVRFFEKVKREVPDIVLENCSSGGHRLEPSLMAEMSMASFSDAHECVEIPIIAANLHRVIHPAQSQIWAVIRKEDSLQRIAYSVAAAFMGRMCISGDVTELTAQQWDVIEKGIAFYKEIAPIIRKGQSYRYGTKTRSARHPEGWQVLVRVGTGGRCYAVMHTFGGTMPEEIEIELPAGTSRHIVRTYAAGKADIRVDGNRLKYRPDGNMVGAAVLLGE